MSKYIFNNDTDILEFLEQLRENGIQIWGEGEKIRYRSKNRQLAPETLRILKMAKASELLGENIIINRIFLINPSKAKESDLYLGDISIIDGNSVAIKSWEKAVLGNVREFESNSNDIFDIIMRELENDK